MSCLSQNQIRLISEFQIRLFQYIKSKADSEDELIKVCKEIVDDDPKLLAELALLFQFTIDRYFLCFYMQFCDAHISKPIESNENWTGRERNT